MIIREFRLEDGEALRTITVQTFCKVSIARAIEEVVGKCGETTWVDRKKGEVQGDIDANPDGVFVAEETGEVVGYITCLVDRLTLIGWIHHMGVAENYQGKGIGKLLIQRGLDYLRAQGMVCCRIETTENNEIGRRFYPAVGFQEVARQIHYVMRL